MDGLKFLEEQIKSLEGQAIPIIIIALKKITHADRLLLNGGKEKLIENRSLDWNSFIKEVRDMLDFCPY